MKNSRCINSIVILFLLPAVLLFSIGCSKPILMENLNINKPSSTKIPLRVGLYMTSGFRNNYYNYKGLFIQEAKIMGEGFSRNAERIMKEVFEEVVVIDEKSDISNQNIKVIVYPEILKVESKRGYFDGFFKIICKWTISGTDGKIYYMNTIISEINKGEINELKLMTPAVKDHFEKLLAHMISTKWWENIK